MPMDRPIPAFYCCYLLRSTVRHSSVYVGSTPNPVRRLAQHNGIKKGGAVRTSRQSLRPWEMSCIVTGFPSHIAALQFEWAWQNPHVTLHIPPESRIQYASQKKPSGHPKRPKHTVTSLLSNLHLLLRVPSFSRWPLELRFFSEDVYVAWLKWCKVTSMQLQDSVLIIKDFPPRKSKNKLLEEDESSPSKKRKLDHGIEGLDVDYTTVKPQVEKAKSIVDFELEGSCSICASPLEHDEGMYTICPNPSCKSVSHLTCLSKGFLKGDEEALVPVSGSCPSCKEQTRWIDVVKELSLRMRGLKEVEKLLKIKRARKGKGTASQVVVESSDSEMHEEDDVLGELNQTSGGLGGDDWHRAEEEGDSDTGSIASHASQASKCGHRVSRKGKMLMVIEDSDGWDDVEIIA